MRQKRGIAFVLCITLLTLDAGYAAPSSQFTPPPVIPTSLGHVEESFHAPSGKTLFYIQDAHDILEAQENIAKIIHYLVKHRGIETVYEEGYEGKVPTDEYFGFLHKPSLKKEISYFLLDKLRIGGAEYAHINRKRDFRLIGAEDRRLYLANLAQYRETVKAQKDLAEDLEAMQHVVQKEMDRHFPPELKEWIKLKKKLNAGQLSLFDYLKRSQTFFPEKRLPAQCPSLRLLLAAENGTNPKAVLSTLSAAVIFKEINSMEKEIAENSLENPQDRQLFRDSQALGLLKRVNEFSVTSEEFDAVKKTLLEFKTDAFARRLSKQTNRPVLLSKLWEKKIQAGIEFYEIANARNRAVEMVIREFYAGPEKNAALVFGGFHKEEIKAALKRQQQSWVILSPRITKPDPVHQNYYKELMAGNHYGYEASFLTADAARPASQFIEPWGKHGVRRLAAALRTEARKTTGQKLRGLLAGSLVAGALFLPASSASAQTPPDKALSSLLESAEKAAEKYENVLPDLNEIERLFSMPLSEEERQRLATLAVPKLFEIERKSTNHEAHQKVRKILIQIGKPAAPYFLERLKRPLPDERDFDALLAIRDMESINQLIDYYLENGKFVFELNAFLKRLDMEKNPDPRVLFYRLLAIAEKDKTDMLHIGSSWYLKSAAEIEGAEKFAREAMAGQVSDYRESGIGVLGYLKNEASLETLLSIAENKSKKWNADEQDAAIRALGKSKSEKAIPLLIRFLNGHPEVPSSQRFQDTAAQALSIMENPEAQFYYYLTVNSKEAAKIPGAEDYARQALRHPSLRVSEAAVEVLTAKNSYGIRDRLVFNYSHYPILTILGSLVFGFIGLVLTVSVIMVIGCELLLLAGRAGWNVQPLLLKLMVRDERYKKRVLRVLAGYKKNLSPKTREEVIAFFLEHSHDLEKEFLHLVAEGQVEEAIPYLVHGLNPSTLVEKNASFVTLSKLDTPKGRFFTALLRKQMPEAAAMPGAFEYALEAAGYLHLRANAVTVLNSLDTTPHTRLLIEALNAPSLPYKLRQDLYKKEAVREEAGRLLGVTPLPEAQFYFHLYSRDPQKAVSVGNEGFAREALRHGDDEIKAQAVFTLALLDEALTVQDIRILAGNQSALRIPAQWRLGEYTQERLEADLKNYSDANARAYAVQVLGFEKKPESLEILIPVLGDSSEKVRQSAYSMIQNYDTAKSRFYKALYEENSQAAASEENARTFAAEALKHPNTRLRMEAALVLFHLEDFSQLAAVLSIFENETDAARLQRFDQEAAEHDSPAILAALKKRLAGHVEDLTFVRMEMQTETSSYYDDQTGNYQDYETQSEVDTGAPVREKAASLFFKYLRHFKVLGTQAALKELKTAVRYYKEAPLAAVEAMDHLGKLQEASAVPDLKALLAANETRISKKAAETLLKINTPEGRFFSLLYDKQADAAAEIEGASQFAQGALQHESPAIQTEAVKVLKRLKNKETLPALHSYAANSRTSRDLKTAALSVVAEIGDRSSLPAMIAMLQEDDALVLAAVLQVLQKVSDGQAVSALTEAAKKNLKGNSNEKREVYKGIIDALAGILASSVTLEGNEGFAFQGLIEFLNHKDEAVSRKALDALIKLPEQNPAVGPQKILEALVLSKNIALLLYFSKKHPSFLKNAPKEFSPLLKLAEQIEAAASHGEADGAQVDPEKIKLFTQSMNQYMDAFLKESHNAAEILETYEELAIFVRTTRANITLVLSAMIQIKQPLLKFQSLRKHLSFGEALTRIIRSLGEERNTIGGYKDVVLIIMTSGHFEILLQIIVEMAKKKQRASPQEVIGMLEILRATPNLRNWTAEDWEFFKGKIERYYANGFKVITYPLFKYFVEHENDALSLKEMKDDIQNELGNIAWGGFRGLSDNFKKKYGLSSADELALLAKYMPVQNLTGQDFAGTYEEIKKAIQQRGKAREDEVDPELRDLFQLKGTTVTVTYQASTGEGFDRWEFYKTLAALADPQARLVPDLVPVVLESPELPELQKTAVRFAAKAGNVSLANLSQVPKGEAAIQSWLTAWHTFLADTYKHDIAPGILQKLKAALAKLNDQALESLYEKEKIPDFLSLRDKAELPRPDNDIIAIFNDPDTAEKEKQAALAEIFYAKWLAMVPAGEISNTALFEEWLKRGGEKFARKILKEIKKDNPSLTREEVLKMTRLALLDAQQRMKKDLKGKSDSGRRRVLLEDRLVRKVAQLFETQTRAVAKELGKFNAIETATANHFYTGFFDDLLHLMGFMMSGVCTYYHRAAQVLSQDYHFGKLAVKDARGKVLGLSQVQLLKTDIQSLPRRQSPKGWRVMALPGINLAPGIQEIDQEKAVHVLLETAQRKAEELGMEGAVVPEQTGIHTNNPNVARIIASYKARGWLKEAKLTSNVILSTGIHAYSYSEVFLVSIPKSEFILGQASIGDRIEKENEQTERLEKESSLPFGEGLGEIIYETVNGREGAVKFQTAVNERLALLPPNIVGRLKDNVSILERQVRIRLDAEVRVSHIHKANGEVELIAGQDILRDGTDFDLAGLDDQLAELMTALILDDYLALKEQSKTNENAYFKLQNMKALLGYRIYLEKYHKTLNRYAWGPEKFLNKMTPSKRNSTLMKYKQDLEHFTDGWEWIEQPNLALSVFDDADPDFLIANYIHLNASRGLLDDEAVDLLIERLSRLEVAGSLSLSHLRNALKEFLFFGKVRLKMGNRTQEKESFRHFDQTEKMLELKDAVITAQQQPLFNEAFKSLITAIFPLSQDEIESETEPEVLTRLFNEETREIALNDALKELFLRKIGNRALETLQAHFNAEREEDFGLIRFNRNNLMQGADADEYSFLEGEAEDAVRSLFPSPQDPDSNRLELRAVLKTPRFEKPLAEQVLQMKEALSLKQEVIFVIRPETLENLSREEGYDQWLELLGLKLMNEEKIWLVLDGDITIEAGSRTEELMKLKNVIWGTQASSFSRLPKQAPVIRFENLAVGNAVTLKQRTALQINTLFDTFNGAFVAAVRLVSDPRKLQEMRFKTVTAADAQTLELFDLLFQSHSIISQAA